jgi:SAM-dependent methyltransferase
LDKRGWVGVFEKVVPGALRRAVPVPLKEWVLGALASRPAPTPPHVLEREHLPRADYDRLWNEAFGARPAESRGYFDNHRERFYELFNALAHYFPDRAAPIRVLNVGVSEFDSFYRRLYPNMRLTTFDRPVADHGADARWGRDVAGSERHYNANLNTEVIGPEWGEPPMGRFDLVICTEVIEHLVLNPLELVRQLLSLLEPGGLLYLTTPNFFRRENLEKIARRENPQAAYPMKGENWDAHHHFRELAMDELAGYVAMAGGRVVDKYYSRCWDFAQPPDLPAEERSNLVIVAARG